MSYLNVVVSGFPKTLCLDPLPLSTSVDELRSRIRSRGGAKTDGFLTVGVKTLRDGTTLGDYDSCCLNRGEGRHVVVEFHKRERGGCFVFSFITLCAIIVCAIAGFCTCGLSWLIIPFLLPLLFILPCCLL